MNLFELFAKITLDTGDYDKGLEDASSKTESLASKMKSGLATAAKVGAAAMTAAATGVAALTKASISNYAEYEQLVGGVETLFKSSADAVMSYAENAYKTAGMSANEYMETVTSFSASLLQSLDGDTEKAAEKADLAITDMADNANKMGTSMESIQNAYKGFAKANYTMLDNLALGYGGTKEEMERLLADAEKLSGVKYDISSYADIVDAIHVVQTEMGIAGTTALEAASTIQGSISTMRSAWENLVTGIGNKDANLTELITNFVDSVKTVGENVIPRVNEILNGIGTLISQMAPIIISAVPSVVQDVLPALIDTSLSLVLAIVDELPTIIKALIDAAPSIIRKLADALIEAAPMLFTSAAEITFQLIDGFFAMLPEIKNIGINLVEGIWEGISSMGRWIRNNVKNFFSGIVDSVKGLLGIHSPSTVFAEMGKNMALGVGKGWDKSFSDIKAGIENGMRFEGDYSVNTTGAAAGSNATFGNITINISGAKYSDENALADAISRRLQDMAGRRAAIYV